MKVLSYNIKAIRKSKGLSQEELAAKLNVVRQTVSKWEQGLSVPDSDMLITISETLKTPVATLLGEDIAETEPDGLKAIAEKLEIINLQLAQRVVHRRKVIHCLFILLCAVTLLIAAILIAMNAQYEKWDYHEPETAVLATAYHAFEWLFFRLAPVLLIAGIAGAVLTRKKR